MTDNSMSGYLNIIILLSSYSFISLINCPWLLLIIMLFIVFLVFVFSEGLLFLSFFWVFFHSSCSSAAEDPLGIYVPDPIDAWTFISLQIKEFHTLAFYINDSIFGSIFFFLTGLHFFHVIVGIILIGIILCNFP